MKRISMILFILFLLTPCFASSWQDVGSPFGRHNDRYYEVYNILAKNGVSKERIKKIFTSSLSKTKDMTPIKFMSTRGKVRQLNRAEKRATNKFLKQIPFIRKHLKKYRVLYNRVEKEYGVNREIVAAILMKETSLGRFNAWRHNSFTVLNTMLGYFEFQNNPPVRQSARTRRLLGYARDNMVGLILFCEKHGFDVLTKEFHSSYAGAIGIPQFGPMWLHYAISASNTVPDLMKMPDAILSTANILKYQFEWPGMVNFERLSDIDLFIDEWYEFNKLKDVSFSVDTHLDGFPLRRYDLLHKDEPNVMYVGAYVRSLMNYNFSTNYAFGILQIAYHTHFFHSR